ncbi:MAG TPA: GtrA family protein [Candidatus Saccharimonadales bacterium]|nr:GtrA family protein [Candidatus Saccharimonadales bacterium]
MLKEGLKFGVVGAISTILDFAFLNLSLHFGASVFWATFIGYAVGTINGYFVNSAWTYKHLEQKSKTIGLTKYAIISAVGLFLTEIIVNYLHGLGLIVNGAKLVAVVIVFFWNWIANRMWTFKQVKS